MTIELTEYNAVIKNPIVTIKKVEDNIELKTCSIHVNLSGEGFSFAPILYGFEYSNSWEDSEVLEWVNQQLIKYQIK